MSVLIILNYFTETSSLNIFFSPDGQKVFMSTATTDLPGPILAVNCPYPKKPTGKKYSIKNCKHEFEHQYYTQIRRSDEPPTAILMCTKCKLLVRET